MSYHNAALFCLYVQGHSLGSDCCFSTPVADDKHVDAGVEPLSSAITKRRDALRPELRTSTSSGSRHKIIKTYPLPCRPSTGPDQTISAWLPELQHECMFGGPYTAAHDITWNSNSSTQQQNPSDSVVVQTRAIRLRLSTTFLEVPLHDT